LCGAAADQPDLVRSYIMSVALYFKPKRDKNTITGSQLGQHIGHPPHNLFQEMKMDKRTLFEKTLVVLMCVVFYGAIIYAGWQMLKTVGGTP